MMEVAWEGIEAYMLLGLKRGTWLGKDVCFKIVTALQRYWNAWIDKWRYRVRYWH